MCIYDNYNNKKHTLSYINLALITENYDKASENPGNMKRIHIFSILELPKSWC